MLIFKGKELLPSEKAFAYKMKMDAMKRQGARNDIADSTYTQNGWRSETAAVIGQQVGESKNQVEGITDLRNSFQTFLIM